MYDVSPRLAWYIYIADIYHWYISDIYPIFSFENIGHFLFLSSFYKYFLMWHIVTMFWFSVCVFCWLMTCALSNFSVLDNFCQIAPFHSNAVWMTRVLHLICKAYTHILLFGSKFRIILPMYVQMLDICIENIGYFRYFWKYHDIFQLCVSPCKVWCVVCGVWRICIKCRNDIISKHHHNALLDISPISHFSFSEWNIALLSNSDTHVLCQKL